MNDINSQSMLRIGTILRGIYKIESYLSSGGFGNTYIAKNIEFDEQYAIKEFFWKGVAERDENQTTVSISNSENVDNFNTQREKFKKEARRLRQLNNTHIVKVYDLFEENGTAYYVMDYVDGENLSTRLKRTNEPLTETEVRNILPQVLDALKAVHAAGIWHLDLKPANIMVDKSGNVKLIDFGASKQLNAQKGGATTSTAISYTNGYAPREQMEQNYDKFGPWTDIYALGATLYALLTNKRPPLPTDIDDDISDDKHVALPFPATVSEEMKSLVLKMMKTNRMQRPQSVEEVKMDSAQTPQSATVQEETQILSPKPASKKNGEETIIAEAPKDGWGREKIVMTKEEKKGGKKAIDFLKLPFNRFWIHAVALICIVCITIENFTDSALIESFGTLFETLLCIMFAVGIKKVDKKLFYMSIPLVILASLDFLIPTISEHYIYNDSISMLFLIWLLIEGIFIFINYKGKIRTTGGIFLTSSIIIISTIVTTLWVVDYNWNSIFDFSWPLYFSLLLVTFSEILFVFGIWWISTRSEIVTSKEKKGFVFYLITFVIIIANIWGAARNTTRIIYEVVTEHAIKIFDDGAEAYAEAAKTGTFTALFNAVFEQAKTTQAFIDANKEYNIYWFNAEGDDLKRLQDAEANCMKAMEEAQKAVEKNYEGKEKEAVDELSAATAKMAEIEKTCPDIDKFTFIGK